MFKTEFNIRRLASAAFCLLALSLAAIAIAQTVDTALDALPQNAVAVPDNIADGYFVARSDAGALPVLPQTFQPVAAADFFNDKLVKNSPLAAEFQSVSVQFLPNNQRLVNRTLTLLNRDAEGRTRREQTVQITGAGQPAGIGPTVTSPVEITDPAAGFGYTFDAATRTAYRYKLPANQSQAAPPWDRTPLNIEFQSGGAAAGTASEQTKLLKLDLPRIDVLAVQLVQGVTAIGKRFTVKIPAGVIGNSGEAETVHEVWYAPTLKMLVKSRTRNPQAGEHSFEMTKLSRAAQPAALFRVPADYRIVEMGVSQPSVTPPN